MDPTSSRRLAFCKWSSGLAGLLQMIIRIGWPFANDHPNGLIPPCPPPPGAALELVINGKKRICLPIFLSSTSHIERCVSYNHIHPFAKSDCAFSPKEYIFLEPKECVSSTKRVYFFNHKSVFPQIPPPTIFGVWGYPLTGLGQSNLG